MNFNEVHLFNLLFKELDLSVYETFIFSDDMSVVSLIHFQVFDSRLWKSKRHDELEVPTCSYMVRDTTWNLLVIDSLSGLSPLFFFLFYV